MKHVLMISLLVLASACTERVETTTTTSSEAATTTDAETTATTVTSATETAATTGSSAAPSAPAVAGPKLLPVDEAKNDPALLAARDELLAAVRERNADKVVALVDPKIRTSFGGGAGAADLRKALSRPGTWEDFEQLLSLGGTFKGEGDGRSFWAPYVYSAWPDAHDPFESLAVIGSDVPLRESSDASAPAIATLSHDIVTRAKGDRVNVKTADGKTGWVDPKQLRSPVGYRAGFMKSGGRWRMNALVSGD
jgi:pyruvate/2-oxoglutarate dehydrogenase complex dihydrolipoamide acyltransferase (E2) component